MKLTADSLKSNIKDNVQYGMFKIGDIVNQGSNMPIMKVIGFDAVMMGNVITEWKDHMGNTILRKFRESELRMARR